MKITLNAFTQITVLLTALLLAPVPPGRAQNQTDTPGVVEVSALPTKGTFWSMQLTNLPPWPLNPFPDLPLYSDGTPENFYYDDRSIDYSALWSANAASASQSLSRGMAQDDVPAPGGDGGGTNDSGGGGVPMIIFNPPSGNYVPCDTWTNFWLQISNSAGVIDITISNTLPGLSYNLLQKTSLNDANWVPIQTLTASGPATAASPVSAGTNPLYFAATLTNAEPPLITVAPSNQVVSLGQTAVFSVTATGSPAPGYQWQFNGVNLPGKTAATLTIANVQSTNVGAYTVIVSNVICWDSASAGLGTIWSNYLGAAIDASPAIAKNGDIFIATRGSMLFALDAAGNVKWSTNIVTGQEDATTGSASLAADGSAVLIGTQAVPGGAGYVDAFNPTNGALLWQTYMGGSVVSTPAISAGGSAICAGSCDGSTGLSSISPTTHMTEWTFQTDDPNSYFSQVDSSAAVGPDCTVYLMASGDLYAISPEGALKWFYSLPSGSLPTPSPAIDAAGNILIGDAGGYVYCISPGGSLQWIFDTGAGSTINSSIAVAGELVVAATQDGNLFGITNGVLAWQWTNPNGAAFVGTPCISQRNEVIIGSVDEAVYCITNGQVEWSYATASYIHSSASISPLTGAVVIGSYDGYVYSLASVGGLASNGWPMFQANPGHTGATPNPACAGAATLVAFPNNPSIGTSGGATTFSFSLSGTPASTWDIYASSNLSTWSFSGSAVLDRINGYGTFTDTNINGVTNRYYRAYSGTQCSQVIGFINMAIPPGTNLIANQFSQINDHESPQNTANWLIGFLHYDAPSYPSLPDYTEIRNWNGHGFDVDIYISGGGGWQPNGDNTLLPGQAVFFVNPTGSAITVPFTGLVAQGTITKAISPGTNFVSSILPQAGRIHSDLGYNPNNGDQVLLWNGASYSNHTYSASTQTWSGGEPTIAVGQGFLLVASNANLWTQDFPACNQPGPFIVHANPLWTDTGLRVNSGDSVTLSNLSGTWTGEPGQWYKADGDGSDATDTFVTGAQFSLIAFVGPNPYTGASSFPQPSGSSGYWYVGTNGPFTTDRSGELWFGFNDDANTGKIVDNFGSVFGTIQITGP